MMKSKLLLNSIAALVVSSMIFVSCAKKREEQIAQGQAIGAESLEAYDGKMYDITTKDAIETPDSTAASLVQAADDVDGKNFFPLVEFETSESNKLLGNVPFRGRPNTQGVYKLLYKLNDKNLVLYKVAEEKDIPTEESFYIQRDLGLSGDLVAVPLAGYTVSYSRLERQKNGDNEETHVLIELPVSNKSEAGLVKVDMTSKSVFDAVKVKDIFPADFFFGRKDRSGNRTLSDEWYYAETVVDARIDQTDATGLNLNALDGGSFIDLASKIVFVPDEKNLLVYNIAVDERILDQFSDNIESFKLKFKPQASIPLSWKEIRTQSAGSAPSLRGEEVTDRSWKDRDYVALDFTKVLTASEKSLTEKQVVDLQIERNYFGFTIQDTSGLRTRHSFLRASNSGRLKYTSRQMNKANSSSGLKSDHEIFGFFESTKPFVRDIEYRLSDAINKRAQMARFNPQLTEIKFYLSSNSPEEFRFIAERAVESWNWAFEKAFEGTGKKPIKITLGEGKKPLGDLRYSVINIIDGVNLASGLFGFGPSVTDPLTGEIISASSNIHAQTIRTTMMGVIHDYINHEVEQKQEEEQKHENSSSLVSYGSPMSSMSSSFYADQLLLGKNDNNTSAFSTLWNEKFNNDIFNFNSNHRAQNNSHHIDLSKYNPFKMDKRKKYFILSQMEGVDHETTYSSQFELSAEQSELFKTKLKNPLMSLAYTGVSTEKSTALLKINNQIVDSVNCRHQQASGSPDESELFKLIKTTEACKEISSIIKLKKDGRDVEVSEKNLLIKSCANELMKEKLLATLIHEMGHNFGLRHNFVGSNDVANFYSTVETKKARSEILGSLELKKREKLEFLKSNNQDLALQKKIEDEISQIKILAKDQQNEDDRVIESSSTMEYTMLDKDRLWLPGKYDIAAIRFGYANAVSLIPTTKKQAIQNVVKNNIGGKVAGETVQEKLAALSLVEKAREDLQKNEKIVSLDGRESTLIQSFVNQSGRSSDLSGYTLKPYGFCTDEDVSLGSNSMCRRHDAGFKPQDVVDTLIDDFSKRYQSYYFKRDRAISINEANALASILYGVYVPMKEIYVEWRYLLRDYLKQSRIKDSYLNDFDASAFSKFADQKKVIDPNFRDFHLASRKIFKFLKEVSTGWNHYCVIGGVRNDQMDLGTSTSLIEFSRIRSEIVAMGGSLNSPSCNPAGDQNQKQRDLVSEAVIRITNSNDAYVISEIGKPYESYLFTDRRKVGFDNQVDFSAGSVNIQNDVTGNKLLRLLALDMLTSRMGFVSENALKPAQILDEEMFMPSFLDEPDFRNQILKSSLSRLLNGVLWFEQSRNGKVKLTGSANMLLPKFTFVPKYEEEQSLVRNSLLSTILGIYDGGSSLRTGFLGSWLSMKRSNINLEKFIREGQQDMLAMIKENGNIIVAAHAGHNPEAVQLINLYNSRAAIQGLYSLMALGEGAVDQALSKYIPEKSDLSEKTFAEMEGIASFLFAETSGVVGQFVDPFQDRTRQCIIQGMPSVVRDYSQLTQTVDKMIENKQKQLILKVQSGEMPLDAAKEELSKFASQIFNGKLDQIANSNEARALGYVIKDNPISQPRLKNFATVIDACAKSMGVSGAQELASEIESQRQILRSIVETLAN